MKLWPCDCCPSTSMEIYENVFYLLDKTDAPGMKLHDLMDKYSHFAFLDNKYFKDESRMAYEIFDACVAHWLRYRTIIGVL